MPRFSLMYAGHRIVYRTASSLYAQGLVSAEVRRAPKKTGEPLSELLIGRPLP